MKTREELISRLEPYAKGCFDSNFSSWIQLRSLFKDIYDYLCGDPGED